MYTLKQNNRQGGGKKKSQKNRNHKIQSNQTNPSHPHLPNEKGPVGADGNGVVAAVLVVDHHNRVDHGPVCLVLLSRRQRGHPPQTPEPVLHVRVVPKGLMVQKHGGKKKGKGGKGKAGREKVDAVSAREERR